MEDFSTTNANTKLRQFNSSSPWNVVAGEGGADLRQLTEHYQKKEERMEDARKARMVSGKVVTVYDDTTAGRFKNFPFSSKVKEPTSDS